MFNGRIWLDLPHPLVFVGAGFSDDVFLGTDQFKVAPNRLFSFALFDEWCDEMQKAKDAGCRLMLDSGAFSVLTGSSRVNLESHTRFVERYASEFILCAGLDHITNPEESWNNWQWQRQRVNVFPTFHVHDPWSLLNDYLSAGVTFLGLGGAARTQKGSSRDKPFQFASSVFDRLCDADGAPRVQTHGFAVGTNKILRSFPWTTVDSTTPHRAATQGRLLFFDGSNVHQLQVRGDLVLLNERELRGAELYLFHDRLTENGYTFEEISEHFPLRLAFNTMEMMRGQALIPDRLVRATTTETFI